LTPAKLEPRLRQFGETLQGPVGKADRPWDAWLIHAATTVTSAACSGWFARHFFDR